MNCEQVSKLLEAYADGEFVDAAQAREIGAHLAGCPGCSAELAAIQKLGALVRTQAEYRRAPERLIDSIAALGAPDPPRVKERKNSIQLWWSLANLGWSAAAILLVVLFVGKRSTSAGLEADLVSAHIRSMQANHLFDVPSSDRHTVKPWFQGKLDFSPDVPNLASDSFPLLGGRLDYIAGHPAAALVYSRGKHTINVFVLLSNPGLSEGDSGGYHVIHWTEHGLTYFAVSDTDPAALRDFETKFEAATGSAN